MSYSLKIKELVNGNLQEKSLIIEDLAHAIFTGNESIYGFEVYNTNNNRLVYNKPADLTTPTTVDTPVESKEPADQVDTPAVEEVTEPAVTKKPKTAK